VFARTVVDRTEVLSLDEATVDRTAALAMHDDAGELRGQLKDSRE
jgi:hypothetical protein